MKAQEIREYKYNCGIACPINGVKQSVGVWELDLLGGKYGANLNTSLILTEQYIGY